MPVMLKKSKFYELIAEDLSVQIREHRLQPGEPLPTERDLAQTYGVGRSSVREAMRMLESRGLIGPAGKGSFVVAGYGNPLSDSLRFLLAAKETDLGELYEARKILEAETAALAALRRTDADLARMRGHIEEMSAGLASQEKYIEADLQFHLAVAAATRNRVVVHVMGAIRDLLHRALGSIFHIPGSPQQSIAQHRLITEAIAAGDPDAARQRMLEHLARVEKDIQHVLTRSAEDGGPAQTVGQEGH